MLFTACTTAYRPHCRGRRSPHQKGEEMGCLRSVLKPTVTSGVGSHLTAEEVAKAEGESWRRIKGRLQLLVSMAKIDL